MKKIQGVILLLLHCLSFYSASAQDTTNTIGHVSIASPTAASLGKYGDIPVNYHTGIPQISIPIYKVTSGRLTLPVSLSYHASGLKVQEPSGWVGDGWTLNAGGAIIRTVMGAPDDKGYSSSNVVAGHYTDYGYNSYLLAGTPGQPDDIAFARGFKDGEPDLYFFNFGGYSGKFYFNDDRTPIFVPEQDFKVQVFTQSGQGFIGFIVTVPDGTRYYFGQVGNNGSVSPIEATNPFTLQNGPANTTAAASSWFLNKIISADGMDSITLAYEQENYSYYALPTYPVLSTNYEHASAEIGNPLQIGLNVTKNLVAGVRLTQISFPNGTVRFTKAASPRTDLSNSDGLLSGSTMTDNANTSSYALGSINISDNSGYCKKDSFYYGYFYDNSALTSDFFVPSYNAYNIHSDQYRLRLDSVQESTCDATIKVPPYKFTYYSEQVPRRLSFGMDHWGYPNGVTSNVRLVPTFTVITSGVADVKQGANREAGWPAMRAGTLQQITYPTGGVTNFDFEPKNVYSFNYSQLESVFAAGFAVHVFGQSRITETESFSVIGTGAVSVSINNTSTNWSPTFTIYNSSGTQVYYSGFINVSSTFSTDLNLPEGNYTATLAFPSNSQSTLINGASGNIYQYRQVTHTNYLTVGGLRIKTITSNDGMNGKDVVTSYNYTAGGTQTTGILYSIPVYLQVLRNDLLGLIWNVPPVCSANGCSSCDGLNAHTYYVSPGSVQPMSTLQGENMGYNEVDVSQTGNGHSVYRYYGSYPYGQNITDVCVRTLTQSSTCDPAIPNFPYPPVPFEFMREEMKYEGHFNEAGQLLKETYYYPTYSTDPLTTPGHISINLPGMFSYTEYNLQSAKKIKDSISTVEYDPVRGAHMTTSQTTYYGSPYHNQPTRKVVNTSTGDSLVTNTKYAFDFRINSCDAIPDSLPYYMTTVHNDSTWMYSTISSCTPQVNNTNNCRWATFIQFRIMMAQARKDFITYRRRSYSDPGNLLATCYLNAKNSADALLKPILRLQDQFNNAPIEVTDWKNQNFRHAGFTRFDTSLSPVGYVYPARTQFINLQTPSGSFTPAAVSGNTVTRDSRYQDEVVYRFRDGNLQQVTGHDGVPLSYIWDYQHNQPIARITNANIDQAAYTSFESDGNGSWTIPSGNRDAANAITGTRSYNLTSGACSRTGLTAATAYIVSYWSKTGSSYSVTGSTGVVQGKTVNGWTYFEHTVTGTATVTVSGSGNIDELRLYPSNAQMITYTYAPLQGMTSQCDENNRMSFYSYDGLGRLRVVKDQDGNIIKTVQYHYKGQTTSL
jgi:hypothetical protein